MSDSRFGRVITAMVTPFQEDGSLDVKGARRLAAHLVDHGSDGLVVCGTTGESPTLSKDEKLALFDNVVREVGDRATVIAGTGTYSTAETIELTEAAAERGVHAALVVTPYYSKPPQNGLLAHFRAVADASPVPLVVYDIPGRTGRRVERSTMVALAGHEKIVAVKDAVGDPSETGLLRAELDAGGHSDFDILSGDDVFLLPHVAAGAVGVVSVCSHLIGERMQDLFGAWDEGRPDEARRIYVAALPLMSTIMTVTTSPIAVKRALELLGMEVGSPRLPLLPPTAAEEQAIRSALEGAALL
jgi:4-hydroxy-tetrahydrodipicolinate synthase